MCDDDKSTNETNGNTSIVFFYWHSTKLKLHSNPKPCPLFLLDCFIWNVYISRTICGSITWMPTGPWNYVHAHNCIHIVCTCILMKKTYSISEQNTFYTFHFFFSMCSFSKNAQGHSLTIAQFLHTDPVLVKNIWRAKPHNHSTTAHPQPHHPYTPQLWGFGAHEVMRRRFST